MTTGPLTGEEKALIDGLLDLPVQIAPAQMAGYLAMLESIRAKLELRLQTATAPEKAG